MPGAVKVPGNPDKVGYQALGFGIKGPKKGDVKHSAEGWWPYLKFLIQSPLALKSWHFTVRLDGTTWQHYPLNVHCWHAGDTDDDDDIRANIELIGIEHEGMAGTELTAEQVQATVAISRYCAEYFDRSAAYARFPVQPADGWTLVEHNEVSNAYTACPSDRVPWNLITEALEPEEDDMVARIIKIAGDKPPTKTYLWQSNKPLLHMKSRAMREETAALYQISDQPIVVSQTTLDAL